jgi:predicted nucleic acid-binding protein
MITAVDTNVLLDVFCDAAEHTEASAAALRQAYDRGGLCIHAAVYAELAPQFADQSRLDDSLEELGIVLTPDDERVAWQAGRSWQSYRSRGGSKARILTDFLIAAHAQINADALLTRDRGFYRQHFRSLLVIDPTEDARHGDLDKP